MPNAKNEQRQLTLGSLFDGSGGFPLAGILSGIKPIWSSEIEPFAIRVTTKRLPDVKHYGDINSMNGAAIEPVDIITFGSPCQDISVAGKRKGLKGQRSGLFYQAIRVIKEMRNATNGKYPRFIVWENVYGAISSNGGEDFRSVLESVCQISDSKISIPKPTRWKPAGEIVGNSFSVAWRTLDSQYFGVPQRRKRMFLVADFRSECAKKILFEPESVPRDSGQGENAWKRIAANTEESIGTASTICLNTQCHGGIEITDNVVNTLISQSHGNEPCVMVDSVAGMFENHAQDCRYSPLNRVAPTVTTSYGTGGNNQPLVVSVDNNVVSANCYNVRFTSEGSKETRSCVYETDMARTIDTGGNAPDSNQGGVAVVYGICSKVSNSMLSDNPHSGFYEAETARTVDTSGSNPSCNQGGMAVVQCDGVCSEEPHRVFHSSKNTHHTKFTDRKIADTLVASDYKDPPTVCEEPYYIVRRLTPRECAKLQGFPSDWCSNLETENPSDEDIAFWRRVFEEKRLATNPDNKPKTDSQIRKWLETPHSDSAEYRLWGNGVYVKVDIMLKS